MRGAIAVGAAVSCLALPAAAEAGAYFNTAQIGPGNNAPVPPYPSSIMVTGEEGTTLDVSVSLHGITANPRDIDALLAGPSGSRGVLMSDACEVGALVPDLIGANIGFNDGAVDVVPGDCATGGPSGTMRPADYPPADNFPGLMPGVPTPYPVGLSGHRYGSPNGLWSLFVVDDNPADNTVIADGWILHITTTGPSPPSTPVKKRKCKRKGKRKGAASAKRKRCKKKRRR